MKHYDELCLASYGQIKSGVFKKNPLPTPKQATFLADLEGLQDMMTKAMHQTMISRGYILPTETKASSVLAKPIR
jgi:hypothetical protein